MVKTKTKSTELTLTGLTDDELLHRLYLLRKNEQRTTLKILEHLIEVERRKLYLTEGHASLFDYCVRRLGYSESGAIRRIRTARCIKDFPEVSTLLSAGHVNLSTVSHVSKVLTEKNKHDLLSRIGNKSQRDVEAIVAEYLPGKAIPDRIRAVGIGSHGSRRRDWKWQDPYRRSGGRELTTAARGGDPSAHRYQFEFGASEAFMEKFRQVQSLMSRKYPGGVQFEQMFDALMDEYLERHDPETRAKRRENRKEKSRRSVAGPVAHCPAGAPDVRARGGPIRATHDAAAATDSRHIPAAVRDEVHVRDNGRCTFEGSNGVRCDSTWGLQIDHIMPHAYGGGNSAANLRLLCGKHNRLEAERVFGEDHMRRFYGKPPTSRRPSSSLP